MGNFCSTNATPGGRPAQRKKSFPLNKSNFIQENLENFNSVYKLNSSPIGTGAFATVWLGTHRRTSDKRAVKVFKKSEISNEEITSRTVFEEVEVLKSLDHPNILKVFEYFEDSENFYIVMEYCKGEDVYEKVAQSGKLSEKYAAKVMKYLLIGVNYMHCRRVVHRDIKPDNLIITNSAKIQEMNVKIIDFNVAAVKIDSDLKGVIGTKDYMAPEVFSALYNEKCDLWSCGVVLYFMVSGVLPFQAETLGEAERVVKSSKLVFPSNLFEGISKECKDFITHLLQKKSSARPSASEALEHPWLRLADEPVDKRQVSQTIKLMSVNTSDSLLKDVIRTFIISQIALGFSKLEKVFYAIDLDKNGVITKDELVKQLSQDMNKEQAETKATKMFSFIDTDGNGEIDFTEFLKAAVDEETLLTKENLKKAFMYLDKDGSEAIEKHELAQWLGSGGVVPADVIDELIQEADQNGDGRIDLKEFEALLAKKLEI